LPISLIPSYPLPDPAKSPTMNFIPKLEVWPHLLFYWANCKKINTKGSLESTRTEKTCSWWHHLCLSNCGQVVFHGGEKENRIMAFALGFLRNEAPSPPGTLGEVGGNVWLISQKASFSWQAVKFGSENWEWSTVCVLPLLVHLQNAVCARCPTWYREVVVMKLSFQRSANAQDISKGEFPRF
jgi:hypothetical protein